MWTCIFVLFAFSLVFEAKCESQRTLISKLIVQVSRLEAKLILEKKEHTELISLVENEREEVQKCSSHNADEILAAQDHILERVNRLKASIEELRKEQKSNYHTVTELLKTSHGSAQLVDVAHKKPAVMSSNHYEVKGHAAMGVDGSTHSYFHTKNENNPWWRVDLQQPYEIQWIEMYNRHTSASAPRLRNIDVYAGTHLSYLKKCGSFAGPGGRGQKITIFCRPPIHAQYVKLQMNVRNFFHLTEVKVYAYTCS